MLEDENKIGETLTLKQQLFCKYFTQDRDLFGNATLSYAEAYEYELDKLDKTPKREDGSKDTDDDETFEDQEENGDGRPKRKRKSRIIPRSSEYDIAYDNCSSAASRLLRNVKVVEYCDKLLNDLLKNEKVDARLAKIIFQERDNTDALNAIKEYNKLKQRIIDKAETKVDYKGSVIVLPVQRDDNGMAKIVKDEKADTTPEASPGITEQATGIIQEEKQIIGGIILPPLN